MLATTLNLTWPLWGERETPPLLPLVPLPAFDDYGAVLIATAACFIFWPRTGLAAHVLVGLIAMIADQTRMQPQIFSFWLLMSATLPGDVPPLLGRSHLASLWFFSGFHKLLSPGYYRDVSSFLWSGLFPPAAVAALPDLSQALAASLAVVELLLGVAVFVPRWRRAAAVVAAMLHLGVLWILYRQQWNTSVWPWNWALAVAGPALIASWKRSVGEERRACGRVGFAACVALFFSPLLFYIGSLDPYLCHCLYSSNVPVATMYPAQLGGTPYQMNGLEGPYWRNLNVPQPPTHRNFELYFRAVAKPGDRMIVVDPRAWAAWAGCDRYEWRRTDTGIDRRPVEPTVLK
jgi:uncharacterized membrane protein YphA (DoxX/SURF4 family)